MTTTCTSTSCFRSFEGWLQNCPACGSSFVIVAKESALPALAKARALAAEAHNRPWTEVVR